MKLTAIIALVLIIGCASFTKTASIKKINVIYDHLIYKDSVFNNGKLKDSINQLRIKRLNKI